MYILTDYQLYIGEREHIMIIAIEGVDPKINLAVAEQIKLKSPFAKLINITFNENHRDPHLFCSELDQYIRTITDSVNNNNVLTIACQYEFYIRSMANLFGIKDDVLDEKLNKIRTADYRFFLDKDVDDMMPIEEYIKIMKIHKSDIYTQYNLDAKNSMDQYFFFNIGNGVSSIEQVIFKAVSLV